MQLFVGAGGWNDQAVLRELRQHVREELGHPDGVFVLVDSKFPKKGEASCGVSRQWCGRLGKLHNCQVGVFVPYAAPRGRALVDSRMYLPEDWTQDRQRRRKTCVPKEVTFQEKWRLSLNLLDRVRADLPGVWVVADGEYGRCSVLRAELQQRHLRCVLAVPCNTLVREAASAGLRARGPVGDASDGGALADGAGARPRERSFAAVGPVGDGREGGGGSQERLVMLRSVETKPRTTYYHEHDMANISFAKGPWFPATLRT